MLEAKNLLQYFIINWLLQPVIGYWPFLLYNNWSTGTLPLQVLASCQLIAFGY